MNVLALGGSHQFAHFLPAAFELHRRGRTKITVFVNDETDKQTAIALAEQLGLPLPDIVTMSLPAPLARHLPCALQKLARLLLWARRLCDADSLLTAERTSSLLRRLPGHCPLLIHIPHGAGDRAVGFEKRFSLFDHVIVTGAKDRDRLVASGLVSKDRCHIGGPIKIASMIKLRQAAEPLFANDRPVVLYNPHFDPTLSSFNASARSLIEAFRHQDRYNLIVAPHVRLARHWSQAERERWESLSVPGRILVDMGSTRSIDMSYTLAADLYIGDVSSQVYEFLIKPRPCLFINSHDARWEGSEDYAMWRCGEVITPRSDILAAVERSFASHAQYRPVQEARARYALGEIGPNAPEPIAHVATIIERVLLQSADAPITAAS
ncbi:glycosyl transferase [Pedomonas mirosovicensis]|uniref:glycosyl transferase n=1 Tax=Pedomonas mirosovicensis TaxID=2908641 RepID=UPI0021692461|nr:glycosyl transferase [Pedomonas mirosovicensis]MCH8686106.1 glycosyl transferase [Pedomonas mirosovicensis]